MALEVAAEGGFALPSRGATVRLKETVVVVAAVEAVVEAMKVLAVQ